MNGIDWKSKLTSNSFWVAVVGFVTSLLTAFNVPAGGVAQVTAIIMAAATLIAYIIGSGIKDAAIVKANAQVESAKLTVAKESNNNPEAK